MNSYFNNSKAPIEEIKKKETEDMDMSPEEYEKYKRDVLNDLKREKQKGNYEEMNEMLINGVESSPKVSKGLLKLFRFLHLIFQEILSQKRPKEIIHLEKKMKLWILAMFLILIKIWKMLKSLKGNYHSGYILKVTLPCKNEIQE